VIQIVTIPAAVILSFNLHEDLRLTIMSLGEIAISSGALVEASADVVEDVPSSRGEGCSREFGAFCFFKAALRFFADSRTAEKTVAQ